MIIATAGHVDHGKTLLVQALTGVDTDRLPEEKKRGLTIELGFAYHDLGDGDVTGFIDVPGHERFIRTMVAGVSGIDLVLFIIAADDGPMPQTAEHLTILDLLGVTRGVIALTKIDRVSDERLQEVCAQCAELLAATPLATAPVVPVSAMTGDGIDTLRAALLDIGRDIPPRSDAGNFRLAVDRSFLLKGTGRVVTGTVFSGRVDSNATLVHVPGEQEVRVRGIHAQNREATTAHAGQRTALNLAGAGLRDGDISRGDWIVAGNAAFTTERLDATIRVPAGEARGLRNRTPVHVHIGAADVTGRLVTFDGQTIEPGDEARAQLMLSRPLHAVRGDRIVLRDQGARRTVGGGRVIDPLPVVRGRPRRQRLAVLEAMAGEEALAALRSALSATPEGLALAGFERALNLTDDEADALRTAADVVLVDSDGQTLAFERARFDALLKDLPVALGRWHKDNPDRPGAGEAELLAAMSERLAPGLVSILLERLINAGTLQRDGALVRLPAHTTQRDPRDEALWRKVEPLLDRDDFKTPVVHDMVDKVRLDVRLLEAFLSRSAQQGYLVKISNKRYFLPKTVAQFESIVRSLAEASSDQVFSVAEFRDASGIGRNAVIEILEYFDRVGLTRRHGQVRKLLQRRAAP